MYFPEPVFDAYSGLKQLTTGLHRTSTGSEALQVVRARHLQYKGPGVTTDVPEYWPSENLSDLARIRRDHEFLRVLATAVAKNGLSNPITDEPAGQRAWPPSSRWTRQFSTSRHGQPGPRLPRGQRQHRPPADPAGRGRPVRLATPTRAAGYGDIEFPSNTQDQQVIDQFLGVGATTDTMTGGQLPGPVAR